jgi:predicted transport protein
MSDIKLFGLNSGKAEEIFGTASDLEKPLQTLIEKNLETLLGIRFLATEYGTGKTHGGRIDTLGLDENNCPVILEYKRSSGENVINQGLFYLDWLMDHQAEFKLLALETFDKSTADSIDWSAPRLVCIAADFTKYDGHAVQQINRNIELIRYRTFGDELLLLELVNAVSVKPSKTKTLPTPIQASSKPRKTTSSDKTVEEWFEEMPAPVKELFASLENYLYSLGDDVQRKDLLLYIAFKRIKNFITVVYRKERLLLYLKLEPSSVELIDGFTRDVTNVGHWGTGNLEVALANQADLDRAKPLLQLAYEGGSRAS